MLVWSDEFDAPGLPDPLRWTWDEGGSGMGNHELQLYTKRRTANAQVKDGQLVLTARREDTGACWYGPCKFTSARLVTRGLGRWRHGRVEVRAKLPRGNGLWPGIWMLPEGAKYGPWPSNGEIDIMESVGHVPGRIHGTVHSMKGSSGAWMDLKDRGSDWHVYGLDWHRDSLTFHVDGVRFHRYKREGDWRQWPFDQPFHLLLNLAVGGSWGGQGGIDTAVFPQELRIDWVRVHKLDPGDGPHVVTTSQRGKGRIALSPQRVKHESLDPLAVTAQAEHGWEFLRWQDLGFGARPHDTIRIDQSGNLEAIFVPKGERIENGGFDSGLVGWTLWHDDAVPAQVKVKEGMACFQIGKAGSEAWMAQFDWPGLSVEKGEVWDLNFQGRATVPRPLAVGLVMDHPPYRRLAPPWDTALSQGTFQRRHRFRVDESDRVARLEFDFGTDTTSFCLDSISLRKIDPQELAKSKPHVVGSTP
ncbi:MAG: hypothetical protein RL318_89 [Fibrobacterota bacterium]